MESFHNDLGIKNKYLERIKAHQLADEIIKGTYWQKGKGCAVGCTIHGSDHTAYESELGIPRWLAIVEDKIFEGLPNDRAQLWPSQFLEAIPVGVDLQKTLIPVLIFIVESARTHTKNEQTLKAIDGVLVELKKDVLDKAGLLVARKDAANAAAYAAYAAANAAYAYANAANAAAAAANAYAYANAAAAAADAYAAYAAYDAAAYAAANDAAANAANDAAAYAADAAAAADNYAAATATTNAAAAADNYAAATATTNAAANAAYARLKEYVRFADKLLELLRDCK